MPTNGLTEALQKWGMVSKKVADQWAQQTSAFIEATEPDARAGAVRDGLALAVTSAVDLATTAVAAITLLVEQPYATTSNWYVTKDGEAGRTVALVGDLVESKDPTATVPVSAVSLEPATLPAGKVKITVSFTTKDVPHGRYTGAVRVSDAAGAELELIPVNLLA
jgi:hypothetical protein